MGNLAFRTLRETMIGMVTRQARRFRDAWQTLFSTPALQPTNYSTMKTSKIHSRDTGEKGCNNDDEEELLTDKVEMIAKTNPVAKNMETNEQDIVSEEYSDVDDGAKSCATETTELTSETESSIGQMSESDIDKYDNIVGNRWDCDWENIDVDKDCEHVNFGASWHTNLSGTFYEKWRWTYRWMFRSGVEALPKDMSTSSHVDGSCKTA